MNTRPLLAACLSMSLVGCSIGRPMPEVTKYIVDLPVDAVSSSDRRLRGTLRMGNVRVAAAFASSALIYRFDDVHYVSDPYHAFMVSPGEMLGSRIAAWLDQVGPFRAVAQPGTAQPASYVLEASVTELYGDFRKGQPPAAVMAMQLAVIDQSSARPKLVYGRSLSRRIELSAASPEALVHGYGAALADTLAQVVVELGEQIDAALARRRSSSVTTAVPPQ